MKIKKTALLVYRSDYFSKQQMISLSGAILYKNSIDLLLLSTPDHNAPDIRIRDMDNLEKVDPEVVKTILEHIEVK